MEQCHYPLVWNKSLKYPFKRPLEESCRTQKWLELSWLLSVTYSLHRLCIYWRIFFTLQWTQSRSSVQFSPMWEMFSQLHWIRILESHWTGRDQHHHHQRTVSEARKYGHSSGWREGRHAFERGCGNREARYQQRVISTAGYLVQLW